jgi:Tol biopolymer transport system component/imidazolonepropionase-like amidohydrolase
MTSRAALLRLTALSLTLIVAAAPAAAQRRAAAPQGASGGAPSWDVNAPPGQTIRQVPIDTNEGTWMNVDLSPDGRTIAFDMLGDIYTMPAEGGTPRRLTSGLSFDQQPRFSPDGRQIAFTSDRGGGDNIWVMSADGSGLRAITNESFTLTSTPAWSPDGRFIAARKHFTTQRSLGTGEIWLYAANGGGGGQALIERPNPQHQKELGEPVFSPDGRYIYFTRDTTPGPTFEYAQDTNQQVFDIERYEIATGERSQVAGGPGGAVRPTPSPDGQSIAFVRRVGGHSRLFVKDLRSGAERRIYDDLDQDLQETWAVHGVYPTMDWTPDSRTLIFWAGGHIRRINADGSGVADIPFHIADTRPVIDPPRPVVEVAPATVTTRMVRFPAVSPDGRQVVYESLGRLYIRDTSGSGTPRLLTANDSDFQLWPSWSRDGSRIVFVSWNDDRLGEVRTVAADGSAVRTVTAQPGHYRSPRFSPDGQTIVFEQGEGGFLTSSRFASDTGVYRVPAAGGAATRILADGSEPHFAAAGDRVFMTVREANKTRLISVDLNGGNRRVHAEGELITGFEVAPDGRALAFRENYNLFATPFFGGAAAMSLSSRSSPLPLTRLTRDGGQFGHWSGGRLSWVLGPTLYGADESEMIARAPGAGFTPPTTGTNLSVSVPADVPQGVTALVGARIITMAREDGGVIEDGVVIVDGNRIRAVGPRASTPIPAGARQVDVAGRTIIPGMIDGHAHGPYGEDDLIPQQNWSINAHLALGVTTIHDPSSTASEVFAASEMQRAGRILGPRIFSSGEVVYGARNPSRYAQIDSYEDALGHVRRLQAQGAHSIKNYNQPRRNQRQQVAAAARAQNILVVPEGGSLFSMDIGLIQDGNSTLEHNLPQARLYDDVADLFSGTRVGYSPTLIVSYGGLSGESYWVQAEPVWRHPLLTRHVPPAQLAGRVRVPTAPPDQYVDQINAREAHRLAQRGVVVNTGGHGQQQGLGTHWDLWSHVRGGATPLEALRHATIDPAHTYGFGDIGSIEVGKLADLVVLDANPLDDIRNSDNIQQVMLNGRLYDAATLNEQVTGNRRRPPYFWERDGNGGPAAGAGGHGYDDD